MGENHTILRPSLYKQFATASRGLMGKRVGALFVSLGNGCTESSRVFLGRGR